MFVESKVRGPSPRVEKRKQTFWLTQYLLWRLFDKMNVWFRIKPQQIISICVAVLFIYLNSL